MIMKQLQSVSYTGQTTSSLIPDLELQIIYAVMGQLVDVYTVPGNPHCLKFYGTLEQKNVIQQHIERFIGEIISHTRTHALGYLLQKGMYIPRQNKLSVSTYSLEL